MDNTAWSTSFYANSLQYAQQQPLMPLQFPVPTYHHPIEQPFDRRIENPDHPRGREGRNDICGAQGMGYGHSPSSDIQRYEAGPGASASQTYAHPNHDIFGIQYGHSPSLEAPRYERHAPPTVCVQPNPRPFDGGFEGSLMDTEVLFPDPDPKFFQECLMQYYQGASGAMHPHSPTASVEESFPLHDESFNGGGQALYQVPAPPVPRSTRAFAPTPTYVADVDIRQAPHGNLFDTAPNTVEQSTTQQNNRFSKEAIVHHNLKADPIAGSSKSAQSSALAVRLQTPPTRLSQRGVVNPEAEASTRNNNNSSKGKGKGKKRMIDDALDVLPPNTDPVRPAKRDQVAHPRHQSRTRGPVQEAHCQEKRRQPKEGEAEENSRFLAPQAEAACSHAHSATH
ncbi:hypothetical protein BJ912DRAFT_1148172 [Pholiota molesta]|nr:hypothetical protein BJ912DRAFT_1148172 [Pholiota molesta]